MSRCIAQLIGREQFYKNLERCYSLMMKEKKLKIIIKITINITEKRAM